MMRKVYTILMLGIASFLISADDVPKFVKNWELKEMNGQAVQGKCTLKIDAKGQYSGKGFCNNYAGNLTFDGKKKVTAAPNMISTKKMCAEGMKEEADYFSTLQKVTTWKVDDGKLIFMVEKTPVLVFEKIVEPVEGKSKKKKK